MSHDIENVDNIEQEVQESLKSLGPLMVSNRIEQEQLLAQSAMSGGPSSIHDAVNILLERAGIGVRHLARNIQVSRKPLQQMLRGERDMSPDIITKIYNEIERVKPGMIDRLAKMEI